VPNPMRRTPFALAAAVVALVASSTIVLSQEKSAPPTVLELMLGTMVPASEAIFSAQAEPPKTQAGWQELRKAADTLVESGGQLTRAPFARSEPEWNEIAEALISASRTVAGAAARGDEDVLLEAGDDVYQGCDTCHRRFLKGPR
jgi:hypothetical protein